MAFHHGQARGRPVIALTALLDKAAQVVVLVGQGVRKLMRQHGRLAVGGGGVGDEKLLAVVIVECGGLFGEQVHFVFGEIEILRDEAEFLEREFLGADLLGAGSLFHAFFQKLGDLLFVDEIARHGAVSCRRSG